MYVILLYIYIIIYYNIIAGKLSPTTTTTMETSLQLRRPLEYGGGSFRGDILYIIPTCIFFFLQYAKRIMCLGRVPLVRKRSYVQTHDQSNGQELIL